MHISTRLPTNVELGAIRRDTMNLEIVRADGGFEDRNRLWSQFLREYEISYPIARRDGSPTDALAKVYDAFLASGGGTDSFDFKDWRDNAVTDEPFGTGDGVTTVFPLSKSYVFGTAVHLRRIYRPVSAITVKKAAVVQSSGITIDYELGTVTFTVAPALGAALTWTGSFNVPVRFDPSLQSSAVTINNEKYDTFTLFETRLRSEDFA